MPVYDCGAADCEECQRAFGPDRSRAIANYEAREREYATPPCRVCNRRDRVAIYDAEYPAETICPECCGEGRTHRDGEVGHVWKYERAERDNVCQKCGITEHTDDGYISDRARI